MDDILKTLLVRHEGLRLFPYRDTVKKLTIGIGRNLEDKGISEAEAYMMLDNDIHDVKIEVFKSLPWAYNLSEQRQAVLLSMAFNMGLNGLLGFKETLRAVETGDFHHAAECMLRSQWAKQVGNRATYLAKLMETDTL